MNRKSQIDAQFSTIDHFCLFDDMSRRQEGALLSVFVDLFHQFLFLHDREVSRGRSRMGRVYDSVTAVDDVFETLHRSATF